MNEMEQLEKHQKTCPHCGLIYDSREGCICLDCIKAINEEGPEND
jgi:hypothetical protein